MKNIQDFIRVYKGAADAEWCDKVIHQFAETPAWSHAVCGADSSYHPDIRNCKTLDLSDPNAEWYSQQIDQEIFRIVSSCLSQYIAEYPKLGTFVNADNGYLMMRYRKGEKVANHIDVGSPEHRVLSCSIQLNDGFTGGDWKFWGVRMEGVEKGDAIIFPSNFCFEHEITPVISGERYSILTFLRSQ